MARIANRVRNLRHAVLLAPCLALFSRLPCRAFVTVKSLHRYPVKSCLGEELQCAELVQEGILGDRTYVVAAGGRALTQREAPRLSELAARLHGDVLQMATTFSDDTLEVPLGKAGASDEAGDASAALFGTPILGKDQGDAAAKWLSRALNPVKPRLLRRVRSCGRSAAGRHWADIAPLLVISTASLEALGESAQRAIPMDRFRPNIVLEGCDPHAEDVWKQIQIGDVQLQALGPCGRCTIVEVAQGQGKRDEISVYGALVAYRGQAVFGQYYRPVPQSGDPSASKRPSLEVGSKVEILA